jgi:hypothetical protein
MGCKPYQDQFLHPTLVNCGKIRKTQVAKWGTPKNIFENNVMFDEKASTIWKSTTTPGKTKLTLKTGLTYTLGKHKATCFYRKNAVLLITKL